MIYATLVSSLPIKQLNCFTTNIIHNQIFVTNSVVGNTENPLLVPILTALFTLIGTLFIGYYLYKWQQSHISDRALNSLILFSKHNIKRMITFLVNTCTGTGSAAGIPFDSAYYLTEIGKIQDLNCKNNLLDLHSRFYQVFFNINEKRDTNTGIGFIISHILRILIVYKRLAKKIDLEYSYDDIVYYVTCVLIHNHYASRHYIEKLYFEDILKANRIKTEINEDMSLEEFTDIIRRIEKEKIKIISNIEGLEFKYAEKCMYKKDIKIPTVPIN